MTQRQRTAVMIATPLFLHGLASFVALATGASPGVSMFEAVYGGEAHWLLIAAHFVKLTATGVVGGWWWAKWNAEALA